MHSHFTVRAILSSLGALRVSTIVVITASVSLRADGPIDVRPDPVLGVWHWMNDASKTWQGDVEFKADGTFAVLNDSKRGKWVVAEIPEGRVYQLNWMNGWARDSITISPEGEHMSGHNSGGRLIFADRIAASTSTTPADSSANQASASPPAGATAIEEARKAERTLATPAPVRRAGIVSDKSTAVTRMPSLGVDQQSKSNPSQVILAATMPQATPVQKERPTIRSVADVLSAIPSWLETRPGGTWNNEAIEHASALLKETLIGSPVQMQLRVSGVTNYGKLNYSISSYPALAPEPHPYQIFVDAYLAVEKESDATGLGSQTVWISGVVKSAVLKSSGTSCGLTVKIVDVAVIAAPPPSSTAMKPGAPKLVLDASWNTPMQGGTATIADLGKLFGGFAHSNVNLDGNDAIKVYENVAYLTPVRSALAELKIPNRLSSKVLIACPGFPRDSLYYYAIDGRFEGLYNRMYLVVDRRDQLVSVQLVDETPKKGRLTQADLGWHTYNFVNTRVKATTEMKIAHLLSLKSNAMFVDQHVGRATLPNTRSNSEGWLEARVDSTLMQERGNYADSNPVIKEQVRWYVPRPIVELILTCVEKGGR